MSQVLAMDVCVEDECAAAPVEPEKFITLISSEGVSFPNVPLKNALRSDVIKELIEATNVDDLEGFELPLTKTPANVLGLFIKYLELESKAPVVSLEEMLETETHHDFDADFFKDMPNPLFVQLFKMSDYLAHDRLFNSAAKEMKFRLDFLSPEEIRQTFNLPNDLTDEEKKELMHENVWVEETPQEKPKKKK